MNTELILNEKRLEDEFKINEKIFTAIEKNENIIFDAGAGSGKTYSLIESIKYIILNYGQNLNYHNQNVLCITYTNVAANEIRERVGNTNLVEVSTIHEQLWKWIKNHQNELILIHIEKLESEKNKIETFLDEDKKSEFLRELETEAKEEIIENVTNNQKLFYATQNLRATDFREEFNVLNSRYPAALRNIANFKKTFLEIFKKERYEMTLEKIEKEEKDYKKVVYNSKENIDRLDKMSISHDTLLDYAAEMVDKYDLLKRILIDTYPYILVDEYQDTNNNVINIINNLLKYSNFQERKLFVGYFGDANQNIYSDGIGNNILDNHSLSKISKPYNRRSADQIIQVNNNILNDTSKKQKSIYDNFNDGSVNFFKIEEDNIDDFIEEYQEKLEVSKKNPVHCLVLTNEEIAKREGFKGIYDTFKGTELYKGYNYKKLNPELLSKDPNKLGSVQNAISRLITYFQMIHERDSLLDEFKLTNDFFEDSTWQDVKKYINLLEEVKDTESLGEYIKSIIDLANETSNIYLKKAIINLLNIDDLDYSVFVKSLWIDLKENLKEENGEDNNKSEIEITNVQKLLDVELSEYIRWTNFIQRKETDYQEVNYHTYHGTKGLEFNNLIIIMGNKFGRNKEYFDFFFNNKNKINSLNERDLEKFNEIKNLLYVSCSRAIKNLTIIYHDDTSNFEQEILEIFGEVKEYIPET